jgi:hypothetical protein
MMICGFIVAREADLADVLTALGSVCRRDFIFGEDRCEWTFRHACTTVNAGIRIDVDPRPLVDRLAGDHAFDRTNIDTTAITNTQTGDYVSHGIHSFGEFGTL